MFILLFNIICLYLYYTFSCGDLYYSSLYILAEFSNHLKKKKNLVKVFIGECSSPLASKYAIFYKIIDNK